MAQGPESTYISRSWSCSAPGRGRAKTVQFWSHFGESIHIATTIKTVKSYQKKDSQNLLFVNRFGGQHMLQSYCNLAFQMIQNPNRVKHLGPKPFTISLSEMSFHRFTGGLGSVDSSGTGLPTKLMIDCQVRKDLTLLRSPHFWVIPILSSYRILSIVFHRLLPKKSSLIFRNRCTMASPLSGNWIILSSSHFFPQKSLRLRNVPPVAGAACCALGRAACAQASGSRSWHQVIPAVALPDSVPHLLMPIHDTPTYIKLLRNYIRVPSIFLL